MRLRIDFAYDGTEFSGWAAQPGRRTVEGELTAGLARVLRADPAPRLTVAGRTDSGVHARGAVAHVDVEESAWLALPGRSTRSPQEAAPARLAGEGRRAVDWPRQVLTAARRDPAVTVMPAHGLCLERVTYPEPELLAARAAQARAVRTID